MKQGLGEWNGEDTGGQIGLRKGAGSAAMPIGS